MIDTPQTMAMPAAPQPSSTHGAPPPRSLGAGAGASFWGEGWRIFSASAFTWIGLLLIFVVICVVLAIIPIIGSLVSTVLMPVFLGGMMLGCHALARGEPLRIGHLFEGFQGGRFGPLAILGLILLALSFVLAILIMVVMFVTIGMSGLSALASNGDPMSLIGSLGVGFVAIMLVSLIGGAIVAMGYWFAPALVVLNGEDPINAIKKSFAGNWANIGAFLVFGLIYLGLAFLATITFGLGWLVLAPMIVGASYAGWRQIYAA